MFRFLLHIVFVIVLMAPQALAERPYAPPPIGTQITWTDDSGGDSTTRVSEVVASGPDFAIYLYDLRWEDTRSSSYFAEFSGVHIASCASPMPTIEERNTLGNLWPLQTGKELTIGSLQPVTYRVEAPHQHDVSLSDDSGSSYQVTSLSGDRQIDLIVSLALNTAVQLAWTDGSKIEVIDVFRKPGADDPSLVEKLGSCRDLLDR